MSHQLLHANTPFLAAVLASSIVAVVLSLLIDRLVMRKASAAARHASLLGALLVAPILLAAGVVGLRLPMPAAAAGGSVDVALAASASRATAAPASGELFCVLAVIWLAGIVLAVVRTIAEVLRWRRIAARAEVIVDDGLEAPYLVARSEECQEPAVIGILDPMVVLPATYDLSRDELRAVFAHELAHIARRDNLTALVVRIVTAAAWFDPFHRLARRRLVELRERVCDELVIARGCDAGAYASALARSATPFASPAVACMSGINLQERMESIMTQTHSSRWSVPLARAFVAASMLAAAVLFATFAPAPELRAGEPGFADDYNFDVRVMPHEDGRFTLNVRIESPDGNFSSVAVVRSAPDKRTVSTTQAGKVYTVVVDLAADGSANATFDVREGKTLVRTMGRTFAAPVARKTLLDKMPGAPPRRLGEDPNVKPPKVVSRVEPVYPGRARELGIAGVVILECIIDETGAVSGAQVLKPLPEGLDQAALDAVKQWRFEPATLEGKPIPVIFNLTINFKLE